ncbi:hypothetical protein B0J15DRAFT_545992 [Fusarium solani]|uniref:PARP catalytic domain-containing protein n=1 Tax=Fusarium solani TaxID=169388 RepID=A0A9P9HZX7_FUSSL|nr:uncharacterized protein B0J15DRAFT_545992 [Fusarium solani]KAH7265972.1 hypothetical protein B0J15DRAFT_545992 [Fusarium solani]
MAPDYHRLNENSRFYGEIREDFDADWRHSERSAIVRAIYHVDEDSLNQSYRGRRFNAYRSRSGDWGCMFGNGVYTTTVSSKADLFAENQDIHSQLHAVFICRIVSNRPQYLRRPDNVRTRPDRGYDSVEAVLTHNGGTVRYPETIVYREDAIIPVGVILYTRRG